MASRAAEETGKRWSAVLAEFPIGPLPGESAPVREALAALEFFLPEVLRERYAEWEEEGLDGILPIAVRKVGEREVTVFALGIRISDQALAPLHAKLRLTDEGEGIEKLDCRIGERAERRPAWAPYGALERERKRLARLVGAVDRVDWCWRVAYHRSER